MSCDEDEISFEPNLDGGGGMPDELNSNLQLQAHFALMRDAVGEKIPFKRVIA